MKAGYSYATFAHNVAELTKTLPKEQAVAAAYAHARKCHFRAHPGGAIPAWLAYPAGYRLREHYDANGRPLRTLHSRNAPMRDNPRSIARIQSAEIKRAKKLYADYMDTPAHGKGRAYKIPPVPKTGVVIGDLIQVGYKSERDGLLYRHTFRKRSRPLLIASSDGKQALIVGGRFVITGRGIEDK